ncbi:DUF960 domain-containing protein [Streptococcus suis]|uniref:DUF960 domain-containing protein n=1 Tax=Streptococcus suis TaxID=1307 RepID=A0A0Z8HV05_STRSU|nr:DUF960 domain-containing protein [Streptococcus suis]MDG4516446.1 DUF960 domain-containing protein [Streptococcus suis]MDG4522923.1 DUF960 domain-containing protein [Streptococcus suis]MDW8766591.1 DUF960 domain-containing protein [Streptococcus suis]MDW8778749.1 DUF960 domain-containing protein [Streptococcus suis]NQK56616.1 DUF960 domain-containing protein [Streptococcus suis]
MAFEQTNGRYASFGVVTSLPGEVIDSFWYVIDYYLKGVIPLKNVIRFSIKNRRGKITLVFSQEGYKNVLAVDLSSRFDPFYPSTILVMDKQGKETITLPDEVTLL